MSCNGCRVLRKGCSDSCILRPCLQWIEGAEAQGHATVFVAKFFGRAGLMNFISAVPDNQRPAVFQSLLYEACGRTVNPVFGAVGLLWSGSWQVCQAAVETVLKGGSLQPIIAPLKPAANAAATTTAPPPAAATNLFHHHFYAPPAATTTTTPLQSRSPNSVLVEVMNSSQKQESPRLPWPGKLPRDLEQQQKHQQQQSVKREFVVLAPVPRRVRPRLVPEEHPPQTLDLDLTLGSSTPRPQENEEEQPRILALDTGSSKRVHSPCLSITSEGSITSVDTADLKISLRHERSSSA